MDVLVNNAGMTADAPLHKLSDDDWDAVLARAGRELTADARDAMRKYATRRPEGHFGRHAYTADRYGLDPEKIETAFGAYSERFGSAVGHDSVAP